MKCRRALGGVLLFVGCIAALAGIAAALLPMVDSEQLRRVLASFAERDDRAVIDFVNRCVSACLRHAYIVAGGGLGLALIGALLRVGAGATARHADDQSDAPRKTGSRRAPRTSDEPDGAQDDALSDEPAPYPAFVPDARRDFAPDTARVAVSSPAERAPLTTAASRVPVEALAPRFAEPAPTEPSMPTPMRRERLEAPSVQRCPACHADNTSFASFCRRCGTDLPFAATSAQPDDDAADATEPPAPIAEPQTGHVRRAPRASAPEYQPPMRVVADAPAPIAPPTEAAQPAPAEPPEAEAPAAFRQPLVGGRAIRMANIARPTDAPVVDSDATVPPGTPTVYVSINAPYPAPMVNVSSTPPERLPTLEPARDFAATEARPVPTDAPARYEPNEATAAPVRLSSRITSTVGVRVSDGA